MKNIIVINYCVVEKMGNNVSQHVIQHDVIELPFAPSRETYHDIVIEALNAKFSGITYEAGEVDSAVAIASAELHSNDGCNIKYQHRVDLTLSTIERDVNDAISILKTYYNDIEINNAVEFILDNYDENVPAIDQIVIEIGFAKLLTPSKNNIRNHK